MEAPVKDSVSQSLLELHGMILDMSLVLAIGEAETGSLWDGLAVGLGVQRSMLACYASSDLLSWTLADQQRHDKSCVVECTCLHNPNMKLTGPLGRWYSSRWQVLDHWYRYAYVESRIWCPSIGHGVGFRVVRSWRMGMFRYSVVGVDGRVKWKAFRQNVDWMVIAGLHRTWGSVVDWERVVLVMFHHWSTEGVVDLNVRIHWLTGLVD